MVTSLASFQRLFIVYCSLRSPAYNREGIFNGSPFIGLGGDVLYSGRRGGYGTDWKNSGYIWPKTNIFLWPYTLHRFLSPVCCFTIGHFAHLFTGFSRHRGSHDMGSGDSDSDLVTFRREKEGGAIGINTAAVYCGLSIGPFWGGFLTQNFGWRSVFYITAILVIIAAILVFWKIKGEWSESRDEKLDVKGSVTLAVSLILILYGFSSLPGIVSIPCIVLGLIGMLLFYRLETRTDKPVLNVSLFRSNRIFVFALLGMLALYCATFAPNFLLSLYLQYNKGFSPQIAGAILVVQFVIMAILAPFSGRISDKIEPLRVSAFGMGVSCIGLVLCSFLNEGSSIWSILIDLAVLGFGFGFFASPAANAIMSSVDKKYFGVAAGTQATMRHTGQVLSMGIVMILFAIYIGDAEITPQYYPAFLQSLKIAFIIFAALCFAGIFAMLGGGRLRNRAAGGDNIGNISISNHQNQSYQQYEAYQMH